MTSAVAARQREHDHVATGRELGQVFRWRGTAGGNPGRVEVDGQHVVPGRGHPAGYPAAHVAGAHHLGRPVLRCHRGVLLFV
jgi:hypothetical protein